MISLQQNNYIFLHMNRIFFPAATTPNGENTEVAFYTVKKYQDFIKVPWVSVGFLHTHQTKNPASVDTVFKGRVKR
jgi:hypothetical protein